MRWESWSQFWAMGGYAVYVWGSVGVTALLMAFEVWQAASAHDLYRVLSPYRFGR